MKTKYEELQATAKAKEKSLEVRIGQLESAQAELEKKASEGHQQRTRGAQSVQQLEVTIEHYKEQLKLSQERQKQMDVELKQQMSQGKYLSTYHFYRVSRLEVFLKKPRNGQKRNFFL